MADVKGKGSGVQRQEDDELLQDLNERSRGKIDDKASRVKADTKEISDKYFKDAYGETNFAENLIQTICSDVQKIYILIKEGQGSAIDGVNASMKSEREKREMIISSLFSLTTVLNAWLPIAAAAVSNTESRLINNLTKNNGADFDQIKTVIPKHASIIQKLGTSKFPGAITSTLENVYKLINTEPNNAKDTVREEINKLSDKTQYTIYSTIFEMAMGIKDTEKIQLNPRGISALKNELYLEIMNAIFPKYIDSIKEQSFSSIKNKAKTEFLKNIILNGGKLTKGFWALDGEYDTIEGNHKKNGGNIVENALDVMGGEEKFAATLQSPYEFAYASLNSTLSYLGLSIKETKDKNAIEKDKENLASNKFFKLNINNEALLKEHLNKYQSRIQRQPIYKIQDGPLTNVYTKGLIHTAMNRGNGNNYKFDFKNVKISKVQLILNSEAYLKGMNNKVFDIEAFILSLELSGKVDMYESYTEPRTYLTRYKLADSIDVSGSNKIKIFS